MRSMRVAAAETPGRLGNIQPGTSVGSAGSRPDIPSLVLWRACLGALSDSPGISQEELICRLVGLQGPARARDHVTAWVQADMLRADGQRVSRGGQQETWIMPMPPPAPPACEGATGGAALALLSLFDGSGLARAAGITV